LAYDLHDRVVAQYPEPDLCIGFEALDVIGISGLIGRASRRHHQEFRNNRFGFRLRRRASSAVAASSEVCSTKWWAVMIHLL